MYSNHTILICTIKTTGVILCVRFDKFADRASRNVCVCVCDMFNMYKWNLSMCNSESPFSLRCNC